MTETTQLVNANQYVAWTQTTQVYESAIEDFVNRKISKAINQIRSEGGEVGRNDEQIAELHQDMYEGFKEHYCIYGLLDEVGEIAGLLKRELRDGIELDREALKLELGDMAWYLARIHYDHHEEIKTGTKLWEVAKHFGFDAHEGTCFDLVVNMMDATRSIWTDEDATLKFLSGGAELSEEVNLDSIMKVFQGALKQKGENKEACNYIAKLNQRHRESDMSKCLRIVAREATSVEAIFLWYQMCVFNQFEPMEVLQANVDKLESRKERGTLHGKGSNR